MKRWASIVTWSLLSAVVPVTVFAQSHPVPVITGFSNGLVSPNTSMNIYGSGFSATPSENIVFMGGMRASVSASSVGSITFTVPPGATYAPVHVETIYHEAVTSEYFFTPVFPGGDLNATSFASQTLDNGVQIGAIAEGDIDGDGKPDVVIGNYNGVGNFGDWYLRVYPNTSSGSTVSFGSPVNVPSLAGIDKVYLEDMNGDGKLDVVTVNSKEPNNPISIFINTSTPGNISFNRTDFGGNISQTIQVSDLAIGDIDGDGFPDMVVIYNAEYLRVYKNSESFSWSTPYQDQTLGFPTGVVIGDFNNDGKPDIAMSITNSGTDYVRMYQNNSTPGTIALTNVPTLPSGGSQPEHVYKGDFDGDGRMDLLVMEGATGSVYFYRRNANAFGFDAPVAVNGFNWTYAALGDVDGDGKVDVVLPDPGTGTVRVLKNTSTSGSISFSTGPSYATGDGPNQVITADLNADGKPEMIVQHYVGNVNTLTILKNNLLGYSLSKTTITLSSSTVQSDSLVTATLQLKTNTGAVGTIGNSAIAIGLSGNGTSTGTFGPVGVQGTGIYQAVFRGVTAGTPNTIIATLGGQPVTSALPAITVVPGVASVAQSNLTASAMNVVKNGTVTVTLQTKDDNGNSLTSGGLPVTFGLTGSGTSDGTFSPVIDFGNGLYSTVFTGTVAGTARSFRATIGGNALTSPLPPITVEPNTPYLPNCSISVSPSTIQSGTTGTITLTTRNINGTPLIAGGHTVTLTFQGGGTSTGSIGPVFDNNDGTYSATLTGILAGTATSVSGTLDASPLTNLTGNTFTVTPGPFDLLSSTASVTPDSIPSGTVGHVTFQAKDLAGNIVPRTDLTIQFNLLAPIFGGGTSTGIFGPTVNNNDGTYTATLFGDTAGTTTEIHPNVTVPGFGNYIMHSGPKVTVIPGIASPAQSVLAIAQPTLPSGLAALITLQARDSVGNALYKGGANVSFSLTGSGTSSGTIGTVSDNGNGKYTALFTGTTVGTARTISAVINGNTLTSPLPTITVTVGPPTITSMSTESDTVGGSVVLQGTNFDPTPANNAVYFGTIRGTVTLASAISLTVTVPPATVRGNIIVTNLVSHLSGASVHAFQPVFKAGAFIDQNALAPLASIPSGNNTNGIATGDLDGDGKPDIIIANESAGTLTFYRNTGSAGSPSFVLTGTSGAGFDPQSIRLADLDGDGKLDIVVTGVSAFYVSFLRNTSTPGSISFASAQTVPLRTDNTGGGIEDGVNSLVLADFNGDGKIDAATLDGSNLNAIVFLNSSVAGSISFAPHFDIPVGSYVHGISAGDLDGDGRPELIVSFDNTSKITVFRNTSSAGVLSFASGQDFASGQYTYGITVGDVDGDGNADVLTANRAGSISIFRNTSSLGSITFAARQDFTTDVGAAKIVITDIDGDGKADLAVTNENAGTVSLLKNGSTPGNVSLGNAVNTTIGQITSDLAVADLDGDGKPDLAVTNASAHSFSLLRNTVPLFSPIQSLVTLTAGSVASGTSITATLHLKDPSGSAVAVTGRTVVFSLTGNGTSTGTFGATTDNGDGTYSALFSGSTAGTATSVQATVNGTPLTSTLPTVTVTAGTFSAITSALSAPYTYGGSNPLLVVSAGNSAAITLQAKDALGNNLTTGGLTVSFFRRGSGTSTGSFGAVVDGGNGTYRTEFTGAIAGTADSIGAVINGDTVGTRKVQYLVQFGAVSPSHCILTVNPDTVQAGTHATISLSVRDAYGNVVTSSQQSIQFALGSGSSFGIINLPDGGWAQLAGPGLFDGDFYGMNVGTPVTITGTINGSPITSTLPTIKVISGQFSTQNSWAEVASTLVASGDSTTLILHAYDTFNNPHTQGNLNVVFTIQGSGTSTGTIRPAQYAGNGNYTSTFVGGHAGNLTYVVPTVNGSGLSTTPPYVVVVPGNYSPTASTLTVDKSVIQSGSSTVITFQAKDAGGDNLSSGGLNVLMSMAHAGTSAGTLSTVTDLQNGQYQAYFQGTTAGTADTVHVSVNSVSLSIALPTITVTPGAVDPAKSTVTLLPSTVRVGATSTVTFQAKDASGNALTSGGLTVSFSLESYSWSGTSSGTFSTVTDHNNGTYTATFTGTVAGTPRVVVTTTNVTPINANPAVTVFGGPIISSFSPTSGNAGTTVTILGSNFNSTLANNIVYFGATRATVSSGTSSSLTVTVPQQATFAPITVADSSRQAVAVSPSPFLPTFSGGDVFSSSSMNAKVDFPVGTTPTSIATADLDGDGKPDLVVTNAASNTITVYRNTGSSGTIAFSARLDSAAGSSPRSVAVGDLDADGKLDIVVMDSTTGTVSIFRNTSTTGTISFANRVTFQTSASPVALALADLDGDGSVDIIVGTTTGITVYRSTGSLAYASTTPLTVSSSLSYLTAVDLNGDGKPEILATSTGANLLTVFHNTSAPGSVSFDAGSGYSTGSNPVSVAAGDLNSDGKIDVIVANAGSNSISYFQNTSSGGSVSLNQKSDVLFSVSPSALAVGEMNGDGKPDVVMTSGAANSVLVLLNIGSSSFNLAPPATFTTGTSPRGVVVADFDGDGRSDLAVETVTGDSISVLKSKIDQFSLTRSTISLGASTVASGSSVVATLQSKDINGANLTTGGATVAFFVSGSGTSTVTFSSVHDNNNGTYTDTLRGIVAGTPDSIGASVNGAIVTSLLPTLQVTGGTAVAATSTVSIQSNVTLGQTATATLVAYDVNGNRVTTGGATVVFSLTGGGSSAGTFSGTTDHGDGTYTSTFTATGLGTARTVSATLNGIAVGTSLPTVIVTVNPPTITAVSPTSGKTGSSVILTGTNFNTTASADTVYFGAAKATVTNASSTSLTVTVPLGAAYGPITLTTNGFVTQSRQFFNKTFASANGTITFGTDSIENVGNGPHGIAVADFNGDGKADFAIANFNTSTVNVMLGNGNGTFTSGGTITTGSGSDGTNYLAAADFNGDGKVDIATSNLGNSNVVVAFGNGDGTFGTTTAPGVGYHPLGITSTDLNSDGLPDIVVTSPYTGTFFSVSNAVTPLLNFGGTSFSAIPSTSAGAFPQGIAAGDFNNDGIPDIAVANSNDGSITICLGAGNGTINATSSLSTGGGFVAVGDFNNDGILDLVAAGGSTPNVNVFLGNGNGTFGGGSSVYSGSGFYQLAVADFNGDGNLDIAVVNQGSNNVAILPGNGNGTFGSPAFAPTGSSPWGIAVADFNGDGKPDLIVSNNSGSNVSFIPNTTTSAAPFSDQPSSLAFGSKGVFSTTIDTVTVSNNSLSSMTISSVTSSSGEFIVAPTSGSIPALNSKQFFVTFQPISAGAKSANIIFTHNLAGSPDTLKATATTSIVRPLISSFSPKSSAIGSSVTIQGSYFNPTAASDLVYFGGVKATVTQASTSQLTVTVPNGVSRERLFVTVNSLTSMSSDYFTTKSTVSSPGVSFSSSSLTTSLPGNASYGSAVGDFNNDGKLDLVVAGNTDSSISVLLGNGNGTFGAPTVTKLTGTTYKVAVADMDGDGKVDIIATSGTDVAILRGNGNGTFNTPSYQLAGNNQVGIAIADFNNDGKLDVAVACSGDSRVSVLLGNGDGTLGTRSQLNSGTNPQDVVAADFNGDGNMDIAVTSLTNGGDTPPVFLGNGNGTFGSPQSASLGGFNFGSAFALVTGDFNGDGVTDLIEVDGYSGFYTTVVYLGNGSVPLSMSTYVQIPAPATGIIAADFNGDGTPDVAVIQEASGGGALTALLGPPGYGNFSSSGTIGTVLGGRGLSVGDFNNDGKVDVVATTYNGSANSSAMVFLNNVALPVGSPVLTSPANLATGISNSPTLSWNSVSGATGYTVDVATDTAFQSIVFSSGYIVTTSVAASNLTASTTYYWRVTPVGLGSTSGSPSKASFTTKIASPVAISPAAGTGLTLDGSNSYVSIPDQPALRLTDSLTLEAWIYPTRNSNVAIIDKGNYNYLFEAFANGNTGLGLYNAAWGWVYSSGTVPVGQWSHVAVVFQTGTNGVKFYLNGALLSQATAPGALTTNTGEVNIGRQAPGNCNCNLFQGIIDEVRIWNKPLTQAQIQATMNVSVAGQSGLVAYYPMDEGSGTTTADASGNGNTGTLVNGPVWTAVDTGVVTYQPTTVTFKWNAVPHADSYGLQVSTGNSFSSTIVNQKNIGTASYTTSGLSLNTTYYWRVNAARSGDTSDYSSVVSFATTPPAPVSAPSLSSPATSAVNQPLSDTLTWSLVSGATSYRLQVTTDSTFTVVLFDRSGILFTSQSSVGLLPSTKYFWRVSAINAAGSGPFSSFRSFTTVPAVPVTPVLSAPLASATNQPVSLTFSWNSVNGATLYELQVSTDSTFVTVNVQRDSLVGVQDTLSGLANNTRYFWRVRGENVAGAGSFSSVSQFTTIPTTPLAPVLALPANASTSQSLAPTLSWHPSVGAQSYALQLSTDSTFASTLVNAASVSDTTFAVQGLAQNTKYFWRVSAKNAAGSGAFSAVQKFTTIQAPLIAPVLAFPLNASIDLPLTDTLRWNKVAGATSYRFELSGTNAFSSDLKDSSGIVDSAFVLTGLSRNTTYYWRVSTANAQGTGSPSTVQSFTTIPSVPLAATLLAPADSAINIPTTMTLSWNSLVRAISYHLSVSTDSTFASSLVDQPALTDTTYQVTTLSLGTRYFWRVSITNAGGTGPFTLRRFTTLPPVPAVPTLASPAGGSVNQPTILTLSWNGVSGAVSYRLQVSADSQFNTSLVDTSALVSTSFQISGLGTSTKYFWRLDATNAGGTSAFSSAGNFTTVLAAPAIPVLALPATAAINEPLNAALSWNTVPGATSYRLQVSTDSTFATTVFDRSGIAGTSQTDSGLTASTTYYWRVSSTNIGGTSAFSPINHFLTVPPIPSAPVLAGPLDLATNQPRNLSFTWNTLAGATSYRIQIAADSTFATTFVDSAGIAGTSFLAVNLAASTTYFWRVSALNAGGAGLYSSVRRLTTVPPVPLAPMLVSPTNLAGNQPTGVLLTWNTSSGALSYHLQVSTNNAFTSFVVDTSGLLGTTFVLTHLLPDTAYYWRVSGSNIGGAGVYSPIRTFTIAPTIPAIPVLLSPSDGSVNQPVAAVLSWNASIGAHQYRVQIAGDNTFSTVLRDTTVSDSTRLALQGLSLSTQYYWRVSAINSGGASAYSVASGFITVPPIPTIPILASPADSAVNQPVAFTIRWNASIGAVSYALQVSADSGFSTMVVNQSGLTDTSYAVSALSNLTTYFWRVNATNPGGTSLFSSVRRFKTIIHVPATTVLVSPVNGAVDQLLNVVLSWDSVATAVAYRIQVSTDSTFATTTLDTSGVTTTSFAVNNLARQTKYYWRLTASNIGGAGPLSALFSFTTIPNIPAIPTLAVPADLAINVQTGVRLQWNSVVGAAFYRVQVASDSNFSAIIVDHDSVASTSDSVSALLRNTTYSWRVRSGNAGGVSLYSSVHRFTTIPNVPAVPALASPADSAKNQPVILTLSWNASTGSSYYRLQVATDSAFTTLVADVDSINSTSKQVTGLAYSTTYFWRVRSTNPGGSSVYSGMRRFKTVPPPPSIAVLASPADSVINVPVTLTLTWNAATGADFYRLQVAKDTGFTVVAVDIDSIAGTSRQITGLTNATTYYWHIRATNAGGSSAYSSRRRFATIPLAPPVPALLTPADSAKNQPLAMTFTWDSAAAAVTYHIQVAKDTGFSTLVADVDTIHSRSFTLSNLAPDTRYYWHLNATNAGGTSAYSRRRTFLTTVSTGIEVLSEGVPRVFALHQNYPNPFNPSTKIEFSLAKDGRVSLVVYDMLGRQVATVFDGEGRAGRMYRATFNASRIASGVYFAVIRTDGKQLLKKMLLLK